MTFNYSVFLDLLQNRGVDLTCPACGEGKLGHGDHLVGLKVVAEDRSLGPGGIAAAAIGCRSCGHLRLFVPAMIEDYAPTSDDD